MALVLLVSLAALPAARASYLDSPQARKFINQMVKEHGFDRQQMRQWMASANRQQGILNVVSRPAEKALEWKDYRKLFLTPDRVRLGRAFIEKYHQAFERARQAYGVPPSLVAAIIGVETRYGRFTGKYRVIDALSTLAFDYPPRSRFFRHQLAQFFLLAREQDFNPLSMRGSYAGAMGFGQFIPASYRRYAVDFDGDHVADIVHDPVDAIGSVGNYFQAHGWRQGEPVAQRVQLSDSAALPFLSKGLKPTETAGEFRRAGLVLDGSVSDKAPARLLRLIGPQGAEYYVTYQNFYVITRYNHSPLYAMAVNDLARQLAAHRPDDSRVAGR